MELEPSLVIILYPDCTTTKTELPFSKDCSMLSNSTWCQIYVNKLYVGERKPTAVKMFVVHDTSAATFNSLKFAQKADKFDGEVCFNIIQASTVVTTGYLLGSSKTMNGIHWATITTTIHVYSGWMSKSRLTTSLIPPEHCEVLRTKSILPIFSAQPKKRKMSTFKWVVCATKQGKCLV